MNPAIRQSIVKDIRRISLHRRSLVQEEEFEVLSTDQILDHLNGYGFQVIEEDLIKPKPHRVQLLLKGIICVANPTSIQDMNDLEKHLSSSFETSYSRLMALFFESKAYLRILGYEKLSLTDLMDPEKEKLAIILSYIISHLSFRKIPWEKAHALFQKNYVILRNASNVMQEYHLGEQTVEEMKYTYERFKQEIEEYRQNNGFLLEELKNFQKRGKEFAVELEHLKTSQQQIITNLEEYKEMIASETERLGEYVSRSKYNLESTQKAMQMYTENSKRSLESIHETENWLEKWEIIHQRFKDDISRLTAIGGLMGHIELGKKDLRNEKEINTALTRERQKQVEICEERRSVVKKNEDDMKKINSGIIRIMEKVKDCTMRDDAYRKELDNKRELLRQTLDGMRAEELENLNAIRQNEIEEANTLYEEANELRKLDSALFEVYTWLYENNEKIK